MSTKIFVNLPVKDLARSTEFFTGLGFPLDQRFSDENAGCLVISDDIYAMLLTEAFFRSFTARDLPDTRKTGAGWPAEAPAGKRSQQVMRTQPAALNQPVTESSCAGMRDFLDAYEAMARLNVGM